MHLTENALERLEEYRETLGSYGSFKPRATDLSVPSGVEVQYIVTVGLPVVNSQVLPR